MSLEEIILTGFTSLVSIALWYKIGSMESKLNDLSADLLLIKTEVRQNDRNARMEAR